jgi:murein DD-endopeptidase MepM/ murein hydrolase activator NlpD
VRMVHPSHAARRFRWRALAGAFALAVMLSIGAVAPASTRANEAAGGYLGFDTPWFASGQSVVVRTDDGGGLSLRFEPYLSAEKIGALRDGALVTVVAGPEYDGSGNGWYLVTDGSIRAYAYAGFLAASASSGSTSSTSTSSAAVSSNSASGYLGYDTPSFASGQAVVVQTDDGGGLSLRFEPRLDAEKVGALRDGAAVSIVSGPEYDGYGNGWYLVTDGSIRAYAYAGFLAASAASSTASSASGASSGETAANASTGFLGFDTPSFGAGASVMVSTDDGGGLSLRLEPSLGAEKLGALRDGDVVRVVLGPEYDGSGNGWYLVTDGSLRAYAYAGFLVATASTSSGSVSGPTSSTSASSSGYLGYDTPSFAEGDRVEIRTDDGGGLTLREEPSVSGGKITAKRDGEVVTIVQGPVYDAANNGWYLVSDGSLRAYAFAGFLNQVSGPSTTTSPSSSPSSTQRGARFAVGDLVTTDDAVNIRNGATVNGSLLGRLQTGQLAEITDGPFYDRDGADWYYVVGDSVQGFAMGDFLQAAAAAASQQQPTSGPTGSFSYPLGSYTLTQGYGCSQYGFYAYNTSWGCRVHNGIDLAAPSYTPILAADGGTVSEAGWCDCGLGYYVKIDHGNGLTSTYGHMAEMPYVRAGQTVAKGETIGPVGSTGLSTGPHVHFMIQRNGVTVNPLDYLG